MTTMPSLPEVRVYLISLPTDKDPRYRAVITPPPVNPLPGWTWPEMPTYVGDGKTADEATRAAIAAWKLALGL